MGRKATQELGIGNVWVFGRSAPTETNPSYVVRSETASTIRAEMPSSCSAYSRSSSPECVRATVRLSRSNSLTPKSSSSVAIRAEIAACVVYSFSAAAVKLRRRATQTKASMKRRFTGAHHTALARTRVKDGRRDAFVLPATKFRLTVLRVRRDTAPVRVAIAGQTSTQARTAPRCGRGSCRDVGRRTGCEGAPLIWGYIGEVVRLHYRKSG